FLDQFHTFERFLLVSGWERKLIDLSVRWRGLSAVIVVVHLVGGPRMETVASNRGWPAHLSSRRLGQIPTGANTHLPRGRVIQKIVPVDDALCEGEATELVLEAIIVRIAVAKLCHHGVLFAIAVQVEAGSRAHLANDLERNGSKGLPGMSAGTCQLLV